MSMTPTNNAEFKVTINTSSPELITSALSRALQDDLTHVASNVNDYLENLEPELVRISQSTRGHAAIAPAPVSQAQHAQLHNGSNRPTVSPLGPVSVDTVLNSPSIDHATRSSHSSVQSAKSKRLGRACDACSRRKVKCDHARPCRNCKDLSIECTFQRPAKRRGPVNRVAEEIRRRKQAPATEESNIEAAFVSPDPDLTELPNYFVSAELVGSFDAIEQFARLFFLYVYPLYPFPHEPAFMSNLESRSDIQDSKFVALLASIVGITAASFPRLARKICTENDLVFDCVVDKCMKVASDLRGAQFILLANFTILDAITSFFLGLVGSRTQRWAQYRLYMGETTAILQMLGLQKSANASSHNFLELELASRLQSAVFTEMQTVQRLGATHLAFLLDIAKPPVHSLPFEVDDMFIYPDEMKEQPSDTIAIPAGPNIMTHIYSAAMSNKVSVQTAIEAQHAAISQSIASIKDIILAAPAGLTSPLTPAIPTNEAHINHDDDNDVREQQQSKHRQARLDVQKTAVQMTALACRTEAALSLRELDHVDASAQSRAELESIAMELALLLKRLDPLHVEPQWQNFVNKMKLMLVPMREMKDTNEDAAFVIIRMVDFEQAV